MQAPDGALVELNKKQFGDFLKHGSVNLAMVGDVFMVRGCYFELEALSNYGISAKGISKIEYDKKKQRMIS